MEFSIASKKDQDEIMSLYQSLMNKEYCTWNEAYPTMEILEDDLERKSLYCMKNEANHIVGVISMDRDEEVKKLSCWSLEKRPSVELARLGVRIDYQNQGIARKLLVYAMEKAKKMGYKSVHFLVAKTNKKAIRSYEKLQFDIVGECTLYEQDWWCYEKGLEVEV